MILNILLVIIGVSLMFLAIYLVPKWQTKRIKEIEPKQKWEAENEFRKTLIQIFGGLVIIGGLLITFTELKESRRKFEQSRLEFEQSQKNMKSGQIASRFSKAVELLSSKEEDAAKIGGIYALEQIAKESPEEYLGTVIEVLSAFIRNAKVDEPDVEPERPKEKGTKESKEEGYKIKPYIQIAITVLGRIRTEKNKGIWKNLPPVNLNNVKLRGANLTEGNLTEANLRSADFTDANFRKANLRKANLRGAVLSTADLTRTRLQFADLTGANLSGANLSNADLWAADLFKAKFKGTDLTSAKFIFADLTRAINLKVEQLMQARSLFMVQGLPPEMKKEIKKKKPELFELPKK